MMDTSRIKKFLESVTDSNLPLEQQTLVFTCDDRLMGESNGKGCTNKSLEGCKSNDVGCTNYGGACNNSDNGSDCKNEANAYCQVVLPPGTDIACHVTNGVWCM